MAAVKRIFLRLSERKSSKFVYFLVKYVYNRTKEYLGVHRIRLPVSEKISIPQTEWLR